MAKRRLLVLLLTLVILSLVVFVGCKDNNTSTEYNISVESTNVEISKGDSKILEYSVTENGQAVQKEVVISVIEGEDVVQYSESDGIKALKSGTAKVQISLKDNSDIKVVININVPTYSLAFSIAEKEVYVGESFTMPTVVKKDGAVVSGQKVNLSVEGDAITVSSMTKQVSAVKQGEATLVATLASDPEVVARAKIVVKEAFFSRDVRRGDIDFTNEDNGTVEITGGQATLVVSKADTKYVFRTYLQIKSVVANNESIGIGSFVDNGDLALWFGLHGADEQGVYYVYIRNFYKGWNPAYDEVYTVGNYQNLEFDGKIECVIVRDGCDYWYSIGGYCGTYHDESLTDVATYPGIYSQQKMMTVSDFSVSYEKEDIDNAKNELSIEVAKLELSPSSLSILEKGSQQQFTTKIYSSNEVSGSVAWSLDKLEMSAGQDGTSISENGLLVLANDAAGHVTVKASIGGKEQSVRIEISAEELTKQSENIKVSGGVGLDIEAERIIFPVDRNFNNANLNLDKALDTLYVAELLKSVNRDYTLEFKVSDYSVADGKTGALIVSLGGANNSIAFRGAEVEAHVWYYGADKYAAGTVKGTGVLAEGNEHTYKIVVANGVYSIYIDGAEVKLDGTPVCNPESYGLERKISFTVAQGTSANIGNIVLTQSEEFANGYYVINGNTTLTEKGFEVAVLNNNWAAKDNNQTRVCYLTEVSGNYIITLDVKFSRAMADAKLAICIGNSYFGGANFEFHVNNKTTFEGQIYPGNWNGPKASTQIPADETTKITIQRINDMFVFYIGNEKIGEYAASNGNLLSFYTFGIESDEGSVTVENLSISTQFALIEGSDAAQAGKTTQQYVVKTYGDAQATVELDDANVTSGSVVLNDDHTVTLSGDAEGSFVIKAIVGDFVSQIKVVISSQPSDQDTDLAISKGGVIQDVANGILKFDIAEKEGVGNEEAQARSEYYAELKTKIRGNFSIEFTVSDYATTAEYPKLMISLGGSHNQFYIAYKSEGARIESFTNTGNWYRGGWNNTPFFTDYNTAEAHTFKVECINGVYTWYLKVNGEYQQLHFYDGGNSSNPEQTLIRAQGDVYNEHSVIISTNRGTVATVSDIKVESDVSTLGTERFVTNNDNLSNVSDTGFTLTFEGQDWFDHSYYSGVLTYFTDKINGDCDISFNVDFSQATGDVKLCFVYGYNEGQEATICNNGNICKGEIRSAWGGWEHAYDSENSSSWDRSNLSVRIEIRGNNARLVINNEQIANVDNFNFNADALPGFYAMGGDSSSSVTVSNFVITPVAAE